MEYAVIHDADLKALIRAVNQNLQNGWEPLGGLVVVSSKPPGVEGRVDYYYQTLIKRKA